MAILRRKKIDLPDEPTPDESNLAESPASDEVAAKRDPRADGPFDSSEKTMDEEAAYVDLGALKIRGRLGFEVRVQADGDSDKVGAAILVTEDAALEIRAFASSRSGGLWNEVRSELVAEVDRLEGSHQTVDGKYGPELHLRIPMKTEAGEDAFQPSRIVVVEGPRWMLRGTFLGQEALQPSNDSLLFQAFQDVIVDRGPDAMASRDPLHLTIPESAVAVDPSTDTAAE